MGAVAVALKVHHAVQAGERGAIALVAMGIEFLLGEDIPTALHAAVGGQRRPSCHPAVGGAGGVASAGGQSKQKTENTKHTSQENDTMLKRVTRGGEQLAGLAR